MRYRDDRSRAGRIATTGLLMALGSILGYVETVAMPSLPVPGVRLGLANVAVVLALALVGRREALFVAVGRVILVGLATGSLLAPTSLISLAGTVAAWSAMAMASRSRSLSVVGWSLAGSSAHIVGQILAASLLVGSFAPLLIAPLSLGASVPAGLAIGFSVRTLLSRFPSPSVSFAR